MATSATRPMERSAPMTNPDIPEDEAGERAGKPSDPDLPSLDLAALSHEELLARAVALRDELAAMRLQTRYGLVWEERPELVDPEHAFSEARSMFPVLAEEDGLALGDPGHPVVLIEGDNFHALMALQYTHAGSVDLIYMDPPYNTGNQDFKYNDSFVDTADRYRHSKWLNFMSPRIELAKKLLKDTGFLVMSIDDNEIAQLKMLCDRAFRDENFVACLPTIMNLKGNQDEFGFAGTHEYTLIYAKKKAVATVGLFPVDDEEVNAGWDEDEFGPFKKGANLVATGKNGPRERRPKLFFPVYVTPSGDWVGPDRKSPDDIEIFPMSKGAEMSWRWSQDKMRREPHNIIVGSSKDGEGWSVYKKQRPDLGDLPTSKPKSVFYRPQYSTSTATNELKALFDGERVFDYPKPVALIEDLVRITTPKDGLVIDLFAGSGTTGQAVVQLNLEDGGERRVVLVTNNEDNICRDVTYERTKRVLDRGLGPATTGLRLFRIEPAIFNTGEINDDLRAAFRVHVTDLLRVREWSFRPVSVTKPFAIFGSEDRVLAILLQHGKRDDLIAALEGLPGDPSIVLYGFSLSGALDGTPFAEAFGERVRMRGLPDELLNTYQRVFQRELHGGWNVRGERVT